MIQFVTFLSPNVGGHDSPLKKVTFSLTIPKRSLCLNHLGGIFFCLVVLGLVVKVWKWWSWLSLVATCVYVLFWLMLEVSKLSLSSESWRRFFFIFFGTFFTFFFGCPCEIGKLPKIGIFCSYQAYFSPPVFGREIWKKLPYQRAGTLPVENSDRFNDFGVVSKWITAWHLFLLHFFQFGGDPETGRIPQVFCKEKSGSATHVDHFLGVLRFFGSTFFHVFCPWHFKRRLTGSDLYYLLILSMLWLEKI